MGENRGEHVAIATLCFVMSPALPLQQRRIQKICSVKQGEHVLVMQNSVRKSHTHAHNDRLTLLIKSEWVRVLNN
jgi:hypothetical protein